MDISIIESTLSHVRELGKSLRENDRKEAEALGLISHKAIHYSFKHAVMRRTCLIDNKVAAMWGVCGTFMGISGQPYLITSKVCEEVSPIKFTKIYIKEVQDMKKLFPILENYVLEEYKEAVRMLKIAKFSLSEPITINNNKFLKFSMRSN